jgi:hypothetical protein
MNQTIWKALLASPVMTGMALLTTAAIATEAPTLEAPTIDETLVKAVSSQETAVPLPSDSGTAEATPKSELETDVVRPLTTPTAAQPSHTPNTPQASLSNPTEANPVNRSGTSSLTPGVMAQVTSVSQLSDVQPTDWAFQALQSLVERYGCIAGYPDSTYRGNRAMTRYEFAAGLNACIDRVNELITAGTANLVTKEDLAGLQRLQEEFAAELATLRGRTDTLEAQTAELEANQFSTTTTLNGQAIFAITGVAAGENAAGAPIDPVTVFGTRARLNFDTSFTGKDLLRTRLQIENLENFSKNTTLTPEGELRFTTDSVSDDPINAVFLDALLYSFPVGENTTVVLEANAGQSDDFASTLNPYLDGDGDSGALSNFGTRNSIYYYLVDGAGIGVQHQFGDLFELSLGYLASDPANPAPGSGLLSGPYGAIAQLVFKPSEQFNLGLTYVHAYKNDTGTGSTNSNLVSATTDPLTNPTGLPVVTNSYGVEASFKVNPRIVVNGWVGYTAARVLNAGDADIWNWAVGLAFPDLGTEGSVAGIIVGMEPKLTGVENGSVLSTLISSDPDTSLHIEGFYQYQLTDNIAVTPGIIWLTAPNHNENNDDVVIGTIRTTFSF